MQRITRPNEYGNQVALVLVGAGGDSRHLEAPWCGTVMAAASRGSFGMCL